MGLFLCKKHGGQGIVEYCEHIESELQKEVYPSVYYLPYFNLRLCEQCYRKANTKEFQILIKKCFGDNVKNSDFLCTSHFDLLEIPEDKLEDSPQNKLWELTTQIYNNTNRGIDCMACVDEIKYKHAVKNDLPVPFEPFLNTLLYENKDKINQLEKLLETNYDFQNSIINEGKKAFWVESGTITKPLTITIYYVTKTEEQDRIIDLVNSFFCSVKRNQHAIKFFEKEVWIETSTEFAKGFKRGEEKLIRNIIIK